MQQSDDETRWVAVRQADLVPPGTSARVSHEGIDIAVFNADGTFYAIGDTCTHAEASLTEGDFFEDIRGWVAECPLHGSMFDVTTGEAESLPAVGNTGKYEVKVEGGVIYVNPDPVTPRRE
ncbi:MAG: non-heme iron oxygenase ferredoxin subunit [Chloroflexota bacterium]|nr:non-heme iron oxygenase ferredoxin subunit [Chloroflexota bacterium]